jgi:NDP-sugar pyrophosphorylase family protein
MKKIFARGEVPKHPVEEAAPARRAVILAGGRGTRLYPYTHVLPKPLMPIGDYPILEVVIRQLARCGFEHITLAVNHQAEIIQSYFNSGAKWGVVIDYSLEKESLSTMGPLKLIPSLPEHFLVMNGDVLTDLDFAEFYQHHVRDGHVFTISACERTQASEYGVLHVNAARGLVGFEEKPVITHEVSMGIYMLSKSVLDVIPGGGAYGFDRLMSDMLRMGRAVNVRRHPGYWLDIGRPEEYHRAVEVFEKEQERFLNGDQLENSAVRSLFRSPGRSRGAGRAPASVAHHG